MAYLALYRKWRPQKFSEVVGQDVVVKIIQNAIKSNRIAHAYLFAGSRGVGKTSVARIFAKALNCENGPAPEPCNSCSVCKKITDGSSFDVLEIDGASNRGVDEVRALRERVNLAPVEGRYKVYIIDEVHMLTVEAFNALLKTLEEPPPHVVFILATTEPHKLPLTIRSRCLFLAFRPIEPRDMVAKLSDILKNEGISASEEVLLEISRRADGSMRDAISLLEQLLALGENITIESLERNFGILSRAEVRGKLSLIRQGRWEELFLWLRSLKDRGVMVPYLFEDFGEVLRRLWLFSLSSKVSEILDLSEEEREFYISESKHWNEGSLWTFLNILERRNDRVRGGSSPFKELEMLFWDLKRKLEESKEIAKVEEAKEKETVPIKEVESSKPVEDRASGWEELLSKVKERKISLYAFLVEAEKVMQDGKLIIRYPSSLRFHYEQIRRPENISLLREILRDVFGDETDIEISIVPSESQERVSVSENVREEKPSNILEHPTFQTVLKLFGGEIVEVEKESGEEEWRT